MHTTMSMNLEKVVKLKKLGTKGYIFYGSIHMKYPEWVIRGYWGLGSFSGNDELPCHAHWISSGEGDNVLESAEVVILQHHEYAKCR